MSSIILCFNIDIMPAVSVELNIQFNRIDIGREKKVLRKDVA